MTRSTRRTSEAVDPTGAVGLRANGKAGKVPSPRLSSLVERFVLHDAPGHLLRRCHQRSEELFTRAVGKDGPTRQQIAVLVTACQHPEATQVELCSLTGIDKNTLTQMIGRLIERGLLERRRSAHDERANVITATAAAHRLLDDVLPAIRDVQDQILAPVPTELRATFLQCLRMISGLDATDEPPVAQPDQAATRARSRR